MGKADTLSRMTGFETGINDNKDITLLKPEHFIRNLRSQYPEEDLVKEIRENAHLRDPQIVKAMKEKNSEWTTEDNIFYWQKCIYVPPNKELCGKVIRAHHDTILAGHPGQYKTWELITRTYWWPSISRDVAKYVRGCEKCQATKTHRNKPVGLLHPHDIPSEPWEIISTDLIGELPESGGYNAIAVVIDKFTKRLRLIPTSMSLTSEGMAKVYRDKIFPIHGLPKKIIHDCGPQYHSQFMKELYRLLGIEANYTTAYHPQTNGQSERTNQEIEHYLRLFINYHQSDWHEWLPLMEFVYNDRVHSATKTTPFFADNGRHPYKGINPKIQSDNPTAQAFANEMRKIREEVNSALKKAAEDMEWNYNKKRKESREYKVGDRVWLEGTNISTDRPMKKLDDKRFGPFKIVKKVGKASYKLDIPKTWKRIHPVFNEVLLTPYVRPEFPNQLQTTRPPPEIVEGMEPEYEVEEVLDSRKNSKGLWYKVHWKGYGPHERTWEPAENLKNAQEAVKDFHKKFTTKPKPGESPDLRNWTYTCIP